jgi:hypothetical protein
MQAREQFDVLVHTHLAMPIRCYSLLAASVLTANRPVGHSFAFDFSLN